MELRKTQIKYVILAIGLAIIVFLLFQRIQKLFIFLGLTLLTVTIVFLNYLTQVPIDFSPVFFLSIIITSTLGFGYTILFIILSGFIPSIFIGGFKPSTFVYLFVNLILNLISMPVSLDFLTEGIILSFLYFSLVGLITGLFESRILSNLLMSLIGFGITLIYFLNLSPILLSLLG